MAPPSRDRGADGWPAQGAGGATFPLRVHQQCVLTGTRRGLRLVTRFMVARAVLSDAPVHRIAAHTASLGAVQKALEDGHCLILYEGGTDEEDWPDLLERLPTLHIISFTFESLIEKSSRHPGARHPRSLSVGLVVQASELVIQRPWHMTWSRLQRLLAQCNGLLDDTAATTEECCTTQSELRMFYPSNDESTQDVDWDSDEESGLLLTLDLARGPLMRTCPMPNVARTPTPALSRSLPLPLHAIPPAALARTPEPLKERCKTCCLDNIEQRCPRRRPPNPG